MRETTTTNCAQDNVRQWTESRNSEPSFNSLAQTKRSEQRRRLRQRRDAASAWAALKMQPTRLFCLLVKTLGNTAQFCVCVWTKRKSQKQSTLIVFVLFLLIVGDASRRSFWSWVCVLVVSVYVCKCVCLLAWMHVCACCCSCFCYSSSLLIFFLFCCFAIWKTLALQGRVSWRYTVKIVF